MWNPYPNPSPTPLPLLWPFLCCADMCHPPRPIVRSTKSSDMRGFMMGSPNATVYRFRGVGLIFDHPSPFVPTRRNVALRGDIHTVRMLYRITILREGLAKLVHVNETHPCVACGTNNCRNGGRAYATSYGAY